MAAKKKDKKWVQKANLDEGSFSAKAKAQNLTVSQYANKVLSPDSKADEKTKKQARLAKTFKKMAKKKK